MPGHATDLTRFAITSGRQLCIDNKMISIFIWAFKTCHCVQHIVAYSYEVKQSRSLVSKDPPCYTMLLRIISRTIILGLYHQIFNGRFDSLSRFS